MEHVAIDLGGRESQICVRSADGTILEERRCLTSGLAKYLERRPPSRVIVETCAEAFSVADLAKASGHEVRIVAATLVRALGVGARRTKTDRRDAQVLSEVSARVELGSVHHASIESRETKSMCGMRDVLVRGRTQAINSVRGWMRGRGIRVRAGAVETFVKRAKETGAALPRYVERQLETIEYLTKQIAEADKELAKQAKGSPTCVRLMTVPGVGPLTAVRFVAALDKISRFPSAHKVESYLGLVPGEHQSSYYQQRLSITKAGSPALRHTLVQAAWATRRSKNGQELAAWATEIEKRRGKRVAVVALARKLAGILFAIWRDGTTYKRARAATPPRPTHSP